MSSREVVTRALPFAKEDAFQADNVTDDRDVCIEAQDLMLIGTPCAASTKGRNQKPLYSCAWHPIGTRCIYFLAGGQRTAFSPLIGMLGIGRQQTNFALRTESCFLYLFLLQRTS